MQILGLLGMYFDALVVEVKTFFTFVLIGSDHTVNCYILSKRQGFFLEKIITNKNTGFVKTCDEYVHEKH